MLYLDGIKLGWVKSKKQKGGQLVKVPDSITNVAAAPYVVGLDRPSLTLTLDVDDYTWLLNQLHTRTAQAGGQASFCLYDTEYPIYNRERLVWVRAPQVDMNSSLLEMGQVNLTAYPTVSTVGGDFNPPTLAALDPAADYTTPTIDTSTMLYLEDLLLGEVGERKMQWERQLIRQAMPLCASDTDYLKDPETGIGGANPKIQLKVNTLWYKEAVAAIHAQVYGGTSPLNLYTSALPIYKNVKNINVVGLAYEASCDRENQGSINISAIYLSSN